MEHIYGIATGPEESPTFVYVGKTVSEPSSYWTHVHRKNCMNGIEKELYEHIRYNGGIDAYRLVVLDTTDSGLSEHDYVQILKNEGHKLLNANNGNTKVAAKTSEAKKVFRAVNREAEKRLSPSKPSDGLTQDKFDELMRNSTGFQEMLMEYCSPQM
jgi:hypothetical protein